MQKGIALTAVLLMGTYGNSLIVAQAQGPYAITADQKDVKLCSILKLMRDEIPQLREPLNPLQRESVISAVRSLSLAKLVSDAAETRRLRVSPQAQVQVYIEVKSITESSLQALRDLGVVIEVVGELKRECRWAVFIVPFRCCKLRFQLSSFRRSKISHLSAISTYLITRKRLQDR